MSVNASESIIKSGVRFVLFNLLDRVAGLIPGKNRPCFIQRRTDFNRILVIELAQMGDALLSTPLLNSIKKTFPRAKVSLICTPAAVSIIETENLVDEIILYPAFWEDRKAGSKPKLTHLKPTLHLLNILFTRQFDLCMSVLGRCQPFVPLLSYLSGAPIRIGHVFGKADGFLTHGVMPDKSHVIYDKLALLGDVFERAHTDPCLHYTLKDKSYATVDAFFKKNCINAPNHYICVSPSTSQLCKLWNVENWVRLIDIINSNGIAVFIGGGPADNFYIEKIYKRIHHKNLCWNVSTQFSINEFAALLSCAQILVTLDSLAMHLSCAVNVPCVALFSRVYEVSKLKPLCNQSIGLTKTVSCAGCQKGCLNPICMNFSVKEVIIALNERLPLPLKY